MIILALDTAGTGCYAAVYDSESDSLLASVGAEIGKGHAELLMGFIEETLEARAMALADIDRIGVAIGPGSFTGIRVGVAAARGFALALGVPAVGISAFSIAAEAAVRMSGAQDILVAIDAKRDELYCQTFDAAGSVLTEPRIFALDEARGAFAEFSGMVCGSGTALLAVTRDEQPASGDEPDVVVIARLAAACDPKEAKPRPLYLRAPDAKPQTGFARCKA